MKNSGRQGGRKTDEFLRETTASGLHDGGSAHPRGEGGECGDGWSGEISFVWWFFVSKTFQN